LFIKTAEEVGRNEEGRNDEEADRNVKQTMGKLLIYYVSNCLQQNEKRGRTKGSYNTAIGIPRSM
jgi:hypothetical protein